MRTIFILMDSLNRNYLNGYTESWLKTPNLDRLARDGTVFDNHYCGSMPCMPARRELMTGRLNFLEAPWGPIEPWDDCLPNLMRKQNNTYSHMITDHYHYFHSGGEAYHTLFNSWELERGQEGDVWHPLVNEPNEPKTRGKSVGRRAYWANRAFRDPDNDEDYSTPRCFARAIEFLDHNHDADNWHLHLEVFDPHEPFDCPKKYRDLYNDTWDNYLYNWPAYAKLDPEHDTDEAVAHIRKRYAGTLTMADVWLGKLFAKMDAFDMWKDTVVILTTDHGYLLGEHGYWAKDYTFTYNELARIPLFVYHPSHGGGQRVQALSATMDVMPTLMELHAAQTPDCAHGKSLVPLLDNDGPHHDAVLYGCFGKDINMTDGTHTYCRQPLPDSTVHHHTAMPRGFSDFLSRNWLRKAEHGPFLKYANGIPHYRIVKECRRHADAPDFNPIYDVCADPGQNNPIHDEALEEKLAAKMKQVLAHCDAPECQYKRVGLA